MNNQDEHFEQVQPSVFAGSSTWHTMYSFIAKYVPTPENKRLFKRWIELTLMLFPCESCSNHAMAQFRKHNIDLYMGSAERLYLYVSGILHEGANDNKNVALEDRPNYYDRKRFFFESLSTKCESCSNKK